MLNVGQTKRGTATRGAPAGRFSLTVGYIYSTMYVCSELTCVVKYTNVNGKMRPSARRQTEVYTITCQAAHPYIYIYIYVTLKDATFRDSPAQETCQRMYRRCDEEILLPP